MSRTPYTPLQFHFLRRLQSLRGIQLELLAHEEVVDELTERLVGRGVMSLYRECVDLGVGDEARKILS
jgi:uncharacterized protein (DUF697 family)